MTTAPPDEGTLYVVPDITVAGEAGVMVCVPTRKGMGVVPGASVLAGEWFGDGAALGADAGC